MTEIQTKTAREIMTTQYEPHDDRAFRRGYHHAVVEALDVMLQPNSGLCRNMRDRLLSWEKLVEEWRDVHPQQHMPEPPTIPNVGPVPVD